MDNKYYYKQELKILMEKFIEEQTVDDNDLGWIPNELSTLMADAAFSVLETNYALNKYLENEGLL